MSAYWKCIYPSNSILENIKNGQFVVKFKNDFTVENLHDHNNAFYRCNEVDINFVEDIFRVSDIMSNNDITLVSILKENPESVISKNEIENGQYFYSDSLSFDEIRPYNWKGFIE